MCLIGYISCFWPKNHKQGVAMKRAGVRFQKKIGCGRTSIADPSMLDQLLHVTGISAIDLKALVTIK